MKNVDVVFTGTLKRIVGPVQTVKRIIDNHSYYYENGYDIKVFSSDDLSDSLVAPIRNSQSTFIRRLKEFSRWLSLHTRLYAACRIYLLFKEPQRLLSYYKKQERNPDIIVFHSIFDCYMYLKKYRKPNTKVVLFTHGDGDVFEMLLGYYPKLKGGCVDRKLNRIAHYVMENVDIIPCIAQIEEVNLLKLYPELKGRTCKVINGITDLTDEQKAAASSIRENSTEPKYRLVCSGNINGRKGQHIIIEALCKIDRQYLKDLHVTIVGDGQERISLEDKVKNNNLQEYVTFTGALQNQEVYKELAKSNIFILMSKLEGLPIALIEALRSGLALISTRVSGIPELFNGEKNGVLLNPDADELVELIKRLDNYDWDAMGVESRKYYEEKYQFSRMRNDYRLMLETVSK